MSQPHEDKQYLAMMAIPVILALIIGFSGYSANSSLSKTRTNETERSENDEREAENGRRENIKDAVASADYEGFLEATAHTPFEDIMTEEAFVELVEQYEQHQAGYTKSPYQQHT